MDRTPAVYIVASGRNGTLYTGVTSDLPGRVYQHRAKTFAGFSAEYGCDRLIWFEVHGEMASAILREKRIKKWNRAWKIAMIEQDNPGWRDLAEDWGFDPLPLPSSPRRREPRVNLDGICGSWVPACAGMTGGWSALFGFAGWSRLRVRLWLWVPAFAGMTNGSVGMTE